MGKNNIQENIRKLAEYQGVDVLGFADASEFKDYLTQRQLLLLASILAALFSYLGLNPTTGEQVDCFFLVFLMM